MLVLFSLAFVMRLNATNRREYMYMTRTTHSLLLLHHPSTKESQEIYPNWERLQNAFENRSDLIIADLDCEKYDLLCKSFPRYRGETVIFHGSFTRHFPISQIEHNEDLISVAERLLKRKDVYTCSKVSEPMQYPSFVFYAGGMFICSTILSINRHLPHLTDKIFWNSTTGGIRLVAYLGPGKSAEFRGNHYLSAYVDFLGDYSLETLGKWDLMGLPKLTRRFGFVVYDKQQELEDIVGLLRRYEDRVLFGSMTTGDFTMRYPEVKLKVEDVPAIVVSNKNRRFTMLRGAVPHQFDRIVPILENVIAGNMDTSMEYQLGSLRIRSQIGESLPAEHRMVLGILACGTITGLVLTLSRRISQCVKRTGRKPVALSAL